MSVTVVNVGNLERNTSGHKSTNLTKSFGSEGTVRVVVHGIEYTFGPGQSRSFSDDGVGTAVAAASAKLRLSDDREGAWKSTASTAESHF